MPVLPQRLAKHTGAMDVDALPIPSRPLPKSKYGPKNERGEPGDAISDTVACSMDETEGEGAMSPESGCRGPDNFRDLSPTALELALVHPTITHCLVASFHALHPLAHWRRRLHDEYTMFDTSNLVRRLAQKSASERRAQRAHIRVCQKLRHRTWTFAERRGADTYDHMTLPDAASRVQSEARRNQLTSISATH